MNQNIRPKWKYWTSKQANAQNSNESTTNTIIHILSETEVNSSKKHQVQSDLGVWKTERQKTKVIGGNLTDSHIYKVSCGNQSKPTKSTE